MKTSQMKIQRQKKGNLNPKLIMMLKTMINPQKKILYLIIKMLKIIKKKKLKKRKLIYRMSKNKWKQIKKKYNKKNKREKTLKIRERMKISQ